METIRQDAGEAGLMLLGSLLVSAEDMRGRLSRLQEHDAELALCDRLIETVQPLLAATDNRPRDSQNTAATIQSVAAVLLQTFHPERSGAALAADVAAAIGRYRARQEAVARSDKRRVGQESGRKCRSRWLRCHFKTKK